MTKLQLLSTLCCIVYNVVFSQSQETIVYFPQEQIILNNCISATNKNQCLYDSLQESVFQKLNEKLKLIAKIKKDTIYVEAILVFNANHALNEEKSNSWVSTKKLRKKLGSEMQSIFFNLEINKIINKKPDTLICYHEIRYKYAINRSEKEISLELTQNKSEYTGGVIETAPIFPGCENLSEKNSRKCFNEQMKSISQKILCTQKKL